MRNKYLVLLGLILGMLIGISSTVMGAVDTMEVNASSGGVEYLNGTEHNTATPSIFVTCIGNATGFNATIYQTDGTSLSGTSTIANNTETSLTFNSLTTGAKYDWVVTCWNTTNNVPRANSSHYFSEVNMQSSISSVTIDKVGYRARQTDIIFTGTWTDSNSSGTDAASLYVCKSSGFTGGTGCSGTTLCSSSDVTTNTTTCTHTISNTETAGTKTFYAYVDDDNNYASAVKTGNWYVAGSGTAEDDEENTQLAQDRQQQQSSVTSFVSNMTGTGWTVLIIIASIVIYFVFIKKK